MLSKLATFRFYEELNDFLVPPKRKTAFPYLFNGTPSIKDAIEAIGIPHVEIDLILVNNTSVDFSYILKNDDYVSVYPVFETLNITDVTHLRNRPLRKTKFILDVHLGKLAKYLRMLGFDTTYENNNDDNKIIQTALADHRIILTRDIGILKVKRVTHGYWIRSQKPKEQLVEVVTHFDLYKNIDPFNRCIECNGQLRPVKKEKILSKLKPMTIENFNTFYKCSSCKSIFWEGSHYDRMKQFVEKIKDNSFNQ
jgi:uncharacterized protein with PIN domain